MFFVITVRSFKKWVGLGVGLAAHNLFNSILLLKLLFFLHISYVLFFYILYKVGMIRFGSRLDGSYMVKGKLYRYLFDIKGS